MHCKGYVRSICTQNGSTSLSTFANTTMPNLATIARNPTMKKAVAHSTISYFLTNMAFDFCLY